MFFFEALAADMLETRSALVESTSRQSMEERPSFKRAEAKFSFLAPKNREAKRNELEFNHRPATSRGGTGFTLSVGLTCSYEHLSCDDTSVGKSFRYNLDVPLPDVHLGETLRGVSEGFRGATGRVVWGRLGRAALTQSEPVMAKRRVVLERKILF